MTALLEGLADPRSIWGLEQLLGKGSYGEVWKGKHKRTDEEVAIKVLEIVEDEIEELENEVTILKRTQHMNIVRLFGTYAVNQENLWLCMELCEVGSALDVIKTNNKAFKEDQISFIIGESLRGLVYLHSLGIFHRDIKAGNILLTRKGEVNSFPYIPPSFT
eukprot:Lithocolla_globosa_v1_NODE_3502_length_1654_cov_4.257036.p1 type:complete len:162 gc:universal NODE_3502_length_1654_cov_4.257036:735-1220(+)